MRIIRATRLAPRPITTRGLAKRRLMPRIHQIGRDRLGRRATWLPAILLASARLCGGCSEPRWGSTEVMIGLRCVSLKHRADGGSDPTGAQGTESDAGVQKSDAAALDGSFSSPDQPASG